MLANNVINVGRIIFSKMPNQGKNLIRTLLPLSVKRHVGRVILGSAVNDPNDSVEVPDGRKFKMIEDRLFLRVYLDKDYEPSLSAVASKLVMLDDVVVDVGANFGWYTTLFATSCGPNGQVIAFEPIERTRDILKENLSMNGLLSTVTVHGQCVGDENGTIEMESGDNSESGLAHVSLNASNNAVAVQVVKLDDCLSEHTGNISYLKMDIEGFEMHALKGAEKILGAGDQPILQIEINDSALIRSGSCRSDVLTYLSKLGYRFYEPSGENGALIGADATKTSDVFCFGEGKYSERLNSILIGK